MAKDGELWHLVEAKREDGSPAIFRIRELDARLDQPRIFVCELPYPSSELSRLPDASSYRRFATFEEQWLDPACNALGWTPVAVKIEDGSFFVYLYGKGASLELIERLSPFDGALGFFDEDDPQWDEYRALRDLLEEAKTITPRSIDEVPLAEIDDVAAVIAAHAADHTKATAPIHKAARRGAATVPPKSKPKAKPAHKKPKPKAKPPKAKPKAKPPKAKPKTKPKAKAKPKAKR